MAIIKTGALVQQITGTVGGIAFQRTRAGQIVRAKTSTTRRRSPGQERFRKFFSAARCLWHDLNEDERRQWRSSPPRPLNSWNWFLAVNIHLQNVGLPMVRTPYAVTPAKIFAVVPTSAAFEFETEGDQSHEFFVQFENAALPIGVQLPDPGELPFDFDAEPGNGRIYIHADHPWPPGVYEFPYTFTDADNKVAIFTARAIVTLSPLTIDPTEADVPFVHNEEEQSAYFEFTTSRTFEPVSIELPDPQDSPCSFESGEDPLSITIYAGDAKPKGSWDFEFVFRDAIDRTAIFTAHVTIDD